MARFYANENLPEPVVFELRRLGHDVLTMRESGQGTFDLDFVALTRRIHDAAQATPELTGQLVRINRPS